MSLPLRRKSLSRPPRHDHRNDTRGVGPTRTAITLTAIVVLSACGSNRPSEVGSTGLARPTATPSTPFAVPTAPADTISAPPSTSVSPQRTAVRATTALKQRTAKARRTIRTLVSSLGSGGASIAAYQLDNGTSFRFGASSGMACASIAKLLILETLLLQHQAARTPLSATERYLAAEMITESDNAAADTLYEQIGEAAAVRAAGSRLGLHGTVPGNDLYWGFTTTSAADYVALLAALTRNGPLTKASRAYALSLLRGVESDQHWGVSAAADRPAAALLKDGWLASSRDADRWIVNSVGIVTVGGHRVLLAVLTQHGTSFDGGIDLVEKLAKISAAVVG